MIYVIAVELLVVVYLLIKACRNQVMTVKFLAEVQAFWAKEHRKTIRSKGEPR